MSGAATVAERLIAPAEIPVEDGINLQRLGHDHVETMYALLAENRDFLGKTLGWVSDWTLEDAQEDQHTIDRAIQVGTMAPYAISVQGRLQGAVSLVNRRRNVAELGCWMAASATGRGVAHKASVALIEFGFGDWDLDHIDLFAQPSNKAGLASVHRFGARKIGQQFQSRGGDPWHRMYEHWRISKNGR